MKHVSHYDKVMWGLYCEYSYIPSNITYELKYRYRWDEVLDMRVVIDSYYSKDVTRSAAQWSFIHSKHYHITKVEPIYSGTLKGFIDYLEYRTYRGDHRRSPYDYKKNGWHFKGSHQCGKNTYRWRFTSGEASKYKRKPEHEKKQLSETEIAKRAWREKKKTRKDKAKSYWRCGAGKFYKKLSNRRHRSFEKEIIYREEYNSLNDVDYKRFLDPWLWD